MGDAERFMKYVERGPAPDYCWLWTGGLYPNGYSKFKLATGQPGGRAILGHRYSYMIFVYPEIRGVINHLCEVKRCVRPDHLEDVTQKKNLDYSRSKVCVRGHDLVNGDVRVDRNSGKKQCRECERLRYQEKKLDLPTAGDIGKKRREIELEPAEAPTRREQPTPAPAPAPTPAPTPAPV